MIEGEQSKLKSEEIQIQIMNDQHDTKSFSSYEQELVDFLREDALENQKQRLSVTFLWFYKGMLVSYITLLNDRISLEGDLRAVFRKKGVQYHSLPALKIGRLCVDNRFLRKGVGTMMIDFSIIVASRIFEKYSGCRFIVVDAKRNPNTKLDSIQFYRKMGFNELKEQKKGATPMYFDLVNEIKSCL
ncbi:GNAT family N-acetyltransferase [Candidatus Woesearchaeota archaeon]|nr:GNAT family N-acetyltransferase [Candidatus Woesearchaeota archaeon]